MPPLKLTTLILFSSKLFRIPESLYLTKQIITLIEHPVVKSAFQVLMRKFKPSDNFRYVPSYSGGR